MLLRHMSQYEADKARGCACTFTVVRDGQRVQRAGHLGRVTAETVWVGAYVYHRNEVADLDVERGDD